LVIAGTACDSDDAGSEGQGGVGGRFVTAAPGSASTATRVAASATPTAGADPEPAASGTPAPGGALVVYSGRSEALVGPVIKQFTEATGIKVEVKYGSTSALAATMLEEGVKSPADVYFAQDPGDLGAVRDLLAPLPIDLLHRVPDWARSPEGLWVGLSGRARVVVYNTAKLDEADLPDSISDFTKPEWKGKIGWAPANASFQAMVSAMRLIWGEDAARAWVDGIQANGPVVFANNISVVRAVAAGEIEVGFVNHYYLHQLIAEQGAGVEARNYFTRARDPGSVVLVAGAGVLGSSQNREAAGKFLEFMLSPVAQQYFADQTYEFPLIEGAAPAPALPSLTALNRPDVDLSRLSDVRGTQAMLREAGAIP
jgi:iron(III) transport system substrate-binding protein